MLVRSSAVDAPFEAGLRVGGVLDGDHGGRVSHFNLPTLRPRLLDVNERLFCTMTTWEKNSSSAAQDLKFEEVLYAFLPKLTFSGGKSAAWQTRRTA